MSNSPSVKKLMSAAEKLQLAMKFMDKIAKESLPKEIVDIVMFHSKGATISALGAGLLPGIGGTTALVVSAGFTWSMYTKINKKIGLTLSENMIKTIVAGVSTNIGAYALGGVVISSAMSFFPGIGTIGSSLIIGATMYALTLISGYIYLKILTKIFSTGEDPNKLSKEDWEKNTKIIIQTEDIKTMIQNAKEEYKIAKKNGDFDNKDIKSDVNR